jgi:hypothetical protein
LVVARPRVLEAMECMTAWRVSSCGLVVGVVEGVRNRLLEFVLELKREAPEAGEVPASELPVFKDRDTQIVHMTIYAGCGDRPVRQRAGRGRQHRGQAGQPQPIGRRPFYLAGLTWLPSDTR